MEVPNEKSAGVGLRDLFFFVLRKWRFIVCLGFGCAALLGGLRVYQLSSMVGSSSYQDRARVLYEQAVAFRESELDRLGTEISAFEAAM